jgi:hypothetical protein
MYCQGSDHCLFRRSVPPLNLNIGLSLLDTLYQGRQERTYYRLVRKKERIDNVRHCDCTATFHQGPVGKGIVYKYTCEVAMLSSVHIL